MTEREFEALVREHRSTIYTVCYMFSTDKDEVADLFQEILINLWRGSGTFRGESALNSWIWKVALNTCISQDRNCTASSAVRLSAWSPAWSSV